MRFKDIPIGAYFVVRNYSQRPVIKKLSEEVIRFQDGSVNVAPPADYDAYEQVSPLEQFIRLTEESDDTREDQGNPWPTIKDLPEARGNDAAQAGRDVRLSLRPDDDLWAWPPCDDSPTEPPSVHGE